ncbi:DUF899 domain-containing protein [Plantactinospora soyae]|uniref:Dithiol-disulfide oxidoreductase (DUF899 family) n=1 Tax=Plantactinospora soyae TaxID=1544732 RepID=A0A927M6K5_9ACTN|nr:DUF899 domain-containing protein [Plantactinospora soyae]MBE1487551.1 putative dithiol-disulfide oxidoreductase (DUF899 family) [Plantactinospora soyae]
MGDVQVASREDWLTARKQLLAGEEEAARRLAELAAQRRALPVVKLEKEYVFDGPEGKVELLDLFAGRRQLIVYHFMFDPAWEQGCKFCSYLVDNIGHLSHLYARDTTLALVSRAPLAKIESFKARMGWSLPWYSSYGSDFNYDFHVTLDEAVAPVEYNYRDKATLERTGGQTRGEAGGLSVFVQDGGAVHHTYSTYGEGAALLHGIDNYLELTPQGRPLIQDKAGWLRHHDRY